MNLKKYRLESGLTQKQLSEISGVSVRQIQFLESPKVNPRIIHVDTALRLSRSLSLSIEELLGVLYSPESDTPLYLSDFEWFIPSDN